MRGVTPPLYHTLWHVACLSTGTVFIIVKERSKGRKEGRKETANVYCSLSVWYTYAAWLSHT
jgi:hypothetical protein